VKTTQSFEVKLTLDLDRTGKSDITADQVKWYFEKFITSLEGTEVIRDVQATLVSSAPEAEAAKPVEHFAWVPFWFESVLRQEMLFVGSTDDWKKLKERYALLPTNTGYSVLLINSADSGETRDLMPIFSFSHDTEAETLLQFFEKNGMQP